ncbi:MAG TPA: crosslink repair DNA glycosylase YcaQ family protein [Selenomonadales bacterium]|nr:crosslink repair DNA glycosylase YcaQ family protein [Selenomonadales bacterium]
MGDPLLSKQQARRFLLAHQELWPPHGLSGKEGVLRFIRRAGCIQFDPLNIVGHNQELVLQSRVKDFRPGMLTGLLYGDRRLLDGWDKNMSIYPVEDWPCFARCREADRRSLADRCPQALSVAPMIKRHIEEHGPVSSADLPLAETVDWPWAPTRLSRAALESMYFWGDLVVHHKVHTRKIYDLADRHLPAGIFAAPDPNQTEADYHDWYVLRRLGGIGLVADRSGEAWLGITGLKAQQRSAAFARLLERGKIRAVRVEGLAAPLYFRTQDKPALDRVLAGDQPPARAAVLAPLDNLLWDRRLIKELFDFDYRWEVYKPAGDREFGYYVLPVLYGDRLIARFEPGRDKKGGMLIIKNWWWEPGVKPTARLRAALGRCFTKFLAFCGGDAVRVEPPARPAVGWLAE